MTATQAAGPMLVGERALGPDLARGSMLLFIALANSHYFLRGDTVLGGFPQDTGTLDRAVTWAIATFVDGRAFPMFGLLFGYGVARIVARQGGAPRETRRLLWRRAMVLVVVGVADGLLFYVGDILAAYGVLLVVGAWVVRWRDRWVWAAAALFFLLTALPSEESMSISSAPPDSAIQIAERLVTVPYIALLGPIGFAAPFLVGLWAGRRRILEQVEQHRRLLTAVAAVGIPAAVLGAQPVALMLARVIDRPGSTTLSYLGPLHDATGVFGGAGYAAAIALLSIRLKARPGRVTQALAATGQRSMTCYLCQSPMWALLFSGYLLDLSGDLSVAATAALATTTWAGTVLLADWMRRTGRRGPFERLVRRVTYVGLRRQGPGRRHDDHHGPRER